MQSSDFAKFQLWQTLTVTWQDIHVTDEGLDPGDYIENYEPCTRRTAGFFLGVKHDHLFLAETDDREAHVGTDAERINAFPLNCVLIVQ